LINSHSIINFPSRPTRPPTTCVYFYCHWPPAPLPGKAHETKKYHNSRDNREHNRAPCLTAPSAHASYKGYGCNNAKPPRPPYPNTMINVVVLGCAPIQMGEGAAAPFIGVHILGEIRPAGGFDTLAESRWETELDRLSRSKNSTIPQSTVGGLLLFGKSAGGRNSGPVCGDRN